MFQRVMIFPMLFPDSKIELKLEKREPLKGRAKTPVTLKQRRVEHNQVSLALWSLYSGISNLLTREICLCPCLWLIGDSQNPAYSMKCSLSGTRSLNIVCFVSSVACAYCKSLLSKCLTCAWFCAKHGSKPVMLLFKKNILKGGNT